MQPRSLCVCRPLFGSADDKTLAPEAVSGRNTFIDVVIAVGVVVVVVVVGVVVVIVVVVVVVALSATTDVGVGHAGNL